jgi:hypothetical protein
MMSEQSTDGTVCVEVWLHFDGHHGEGLDFIEAETPDGESIDLGEWDIGRGGSTLKLEVPEWCVTTDNEQKGDSE